LSGRGVYGRVSLILCHVNLNALLSCGFLVVFGCRDCGTAPS
jgi:hypothetical protein